MDETKLRRRIVKTWGKKKIIAERFIILTKKEVIFPDAGPGQNLAYKSISLKT